MADIIHLLPDAVANQIAAGEVIQRPSSVVKELLENSLDAGATDIQLWVQDAGKTSLTVSDNGKGMSETDSRLAFERHATSKIKQASDLYALHTMGFRGEALPSIAAVSQVEVKTRTAEDELGVYLTLSGSKIEEQIPIACKVGTTFVVKNIFFNVPARRRFLKSNQTELNNIMMEFERFALAHPDIRLSIYNNKTLQLSLRPENRKQRIVDLFGTKIGKQLLSIDVDTTLVRIVGFIGTPESARRRGAQQFFFVNGRFMRHPYYHRAVVSVFENIVKPGEQVPYFIYLEVDPSHIDVNIHPTKTEIKFEDEQAIWQILIASVREALAKHNAVPMIDFNTEAKPDIPVMTGIRSASPVMPTVDKGFNPFASSQNNVSSSSRVFPPSSVQESWKELLDIVSSKKGSESSSVIDRTPVSEDSELLLSSQVSKTESSGWEEKSLVHYLYKNRYILTSVRSGLMVIDRQRAMERILYERYLKQMSEHNRPSQRLLFPLLVQLSPSQRVTFHFIEEELLSVGFDFSDLKDGNIAINATPAGIGDVGIPSLINDILEATRLQTKSAAEEVNHIIARLMSKKASSQTEEEINNDAMSTLIDELFSCSAPNYTEDGKRIVSILSHEKIEAMFR